MTVVIVKHENCGQLYIFKVPCGQALKAGDLVLLDTKKGNRLGTCVCNSFEVNDQSVADRIYSAFRIKEPTAYVIGRYSLDKFEVDKKTDDVQS